MINLRQWNGISQIFLYRTERKWIFHQNPFPRDSSYQKRRYPDLRRNADIADTENSSISYQYEETFVEKQESITGNTRMILNAYQELLNKTYSLVDEAQIARISRYLNQAERVFVCGTGSSGLAAREMELRFMRIGVDIDSLVERDMMRMQAVFQDRRSLVFGISISGSKEEVLFLLKEAYRKGAKTILFTANNRGDFEQFCTEVVLIPSLRHLNHGNVISPQFPILVMLDIIYSYYLEQDKYEKEVLHDNTLRALEEGEGMHRSF